MRELTLRYGGACRKCGAALAVGAQAIYERRVGIWCLTCAPTDPEEVRESRQAARDAKAARYEEWAEKRRGKAEALDARNAPYRGDIAFNTQPGHIPERARVIARTEKAWEHSSTAQRFEEKAERLRRPAPVAGDAERKRERMRELIRPALRVGMKVASPMWGEGLIVRIFRNTVHMKNARGNRLQEGIHWLGGEELAAAIKALRAPVDGQEVTA